jgi:N6-adenosine-specific RNA methylase IME4
MSTLTTPKRYKRVVADVPWHFLNWSADETGKIHNRARGANKYYPTENLDIICSLVPPTDDNAVLFFWTISSHLFLSEKVMEAWGFTFKSIAWWWRKVDKKGNPRMGMGYSTRQTGELCLLGVKGDVPRPKYKSERGEITSERMPRHSMKPPEQYAKIDRLYPDMGPSLEMYCWGDPQPGWDGFGLDCTNSIIIVSSLDNKEYPCYDER